MNWQQIKNERRNDCTTIKKDFPFNRKEKKEMKQRNQSIIELWKKEERCSEKFEEIWYFEFHLNSVHVLHFSTSSNTFSIMTYNSFGFCLNLIVQSFNSLSNLFLPKEEKNQNQTEKERQRSRENDKDFSTHRMWCIFIISCATKKRFFFFFVIKPYLWHNFSVCISKKEMKRDDFYPLSIYHILVW